VFEQQTDATAGAEELSNGMAETYTCVSPIFDARAKRLWGRRGLCVVEGYGSKRAEQCR
jgi:hypothetical protein